MAVCGPHPFAAPGQPGQDAHPVSAAHPCGQGRAGDPLPDLLRLHLSVCCAEQVMFLAQPGAELPGCPPLWPVAVRGMLHVGQGMMSGFSCNCRIAQQVCARLLRSLGAGTVPLPLSKQCTRCEASLNALLGEKIDCERWMPLQVAGRFTTGSFHGSTQEGWGAEEQDGLIG